MKLLPKLSSISLVACIVLGCSKTPQDPPGYVEPPSKENLPLVEHPEYTHWKQFEVGTRVVRSKEVTNQNGTVYVTTVTTLKNLTDDKVVIEQQITVVRPEGTQENPPQDLEFASEFRMPEGMNLDFFLLPSPKAEKTGSEKIIVAGVEYDADIFEWKEMNEAGPMDVKLWSSNQMPGRMLREETLIIRDGDTSQELVTDLVQPKSGS